MTKNEVAVATPPLKEAYQIIQDVIVHRDPGTCLPGPYRSGKTTTIHRTVSQLNATFPNLPVGIALAKGHDAFTQGTFFSDLLQDFDHGGALRGTTQEKRIRCLNMLVGQARSLNSDRYLLMVDEGQNWGEPQWTWLRDLANDMGDKKHVRLMTVTFGLSADLTKLRTLLISRGRTDLLGRFLLHSREFRGLPHSSFSQVHGRSFLSGTWATQKARGITGKSVLPGFLTSFCGGWATAIADDSRLRLCRSCADVGYQSALFQIDALSACPIHDEPLVDVCSHCNAPTPRYALSQEAFLCPMQCPVCGAGYGRAWNGMADFANWTGPGDLGPLKRLGQRLQSLQSLRLQWPTAATWVDDPSGVPATRRRIHVFHTLMSLSAVAADATSVVTTRTWACLPAIARGQPPREEPRIAIYKAIRRQIIKRLGLGWMRKGFRFHDLFYRHRVNEAVVPKQAQCIPGLHALVLWTSRCEDLDSNLITKRDPGLPLADSSRLLRLRARMLRWPTDVEVPDVAWGQFIWKCFLEDLWTARRWQALVAPLGDPLEQADQTSTLVQSNRAVFLVHLAAWTPKMSPLLEPFPSGISHFTWQQGRAQRQFGLVTIHRFAGAWHDNSRNATNA